MKRYYGINLPPICRTNISFTGGVGKEQVTKTWM